MLPKLVNFYLDIMGGKSLQGVKSLQVAITSGVKTLDSPILNTSLLGQYQYKGFKSLY